MSKCQIGQIMEVLDDTWKGLDFSIWYHGTTRDLGKEETIWMVIFLKNK